MFQKRQLNKNYEILRELNRNQMEAQEKKISVRENTKGEYNFILLINNFNNSIIIKIIISFSRLNIYLKKKNCYQYSFIHLLLQKKRKIQVEMNSKV